MAEDRIPTPAPTGEHLMPGSPRTAPALNGSPGRLPRPALVQGLWRRFWKGEPATAVPPTPTQPADSVREIVETVVFVVVLVLLLKSFVAEAFVIPTGSMAETLFGYQKMVRCPQCEFFFPVNCSSEVDPQDGHPQKVLGCTCPNCRLHVDLRDETGSNSGDRVLVAKFLYDLLNRHPDRLDVVVFKYPGDGSGRHGYAWPKTGPFKGHVPMNYIKRLIGEPGETIVIHAGNLYVLPAELSPAYPDDPAQAAAEGSPPQLWLTRFMHVKTGEEAAAFFRKHRDQLKILRKSPEKMLSMRRIVYDNDHPARDLTVDPAFARWVEDGGGWSEQVNDRGFRSTGPEDVASWLRYRHVLRGDKRPQLVTDFMGYNTYEASPHRSPGENWVGDLMLDCEVTVEKAGGTLLLELCKGVDRFQAQISLDGSGSCKLVRLADGHEEQLDSHATPITKPGTYRLRFANFDERLTLWVGGELPFGDGVVYPPPAQPGPVARNDLQPASVGSRGAAVSVRKLQVWRDTYYTVARNDLASDSDVDGVDFADPSRWDALSELPFKTLYVQPGHYLCLGDNSPESSDGRAWGLVPERLLLGRALLVYWPVHPVNRTGRIR